MMTSASGASPVIYFCRLRAPARLIIIVSALMMALGSSPRLIGQAINLELYLPYVVGDASTFSSDANFNLTLTATSDADFNWHVTGPDEGLRQKFRLNTSGLALLSEEGVAVGGAAVSTETHTPPWVVAPVSLSAEQTVNSTTTYAGSEPGVIWNGTANGTFVVGGSESVVTPTGTFTALKLTFTSAWMETGTGYTANGTTTQTWWVVPDLGIVKLEYAFQENVTEAGQTETETGQLTFVLKTSTRLALPVITQQPAARTVFVGDAAQFSVTAVGPGPLLYQWFKGGTTTIPSATLPTLSIPNAQLTDSGSYSVEVRNANGGIRSSNAVLTVNAAPAFVAIPDPCLKDRILRLLGRLTGELTVAEMRTLTTLVANRCLATNLTGLEFAVNLASLDVSENNIADLTPLAGLTNLTSLRVGKNRITDLSSVAKLTKLTELSAGNNLITDLGPVAGLSVISRLIVENNQIEDISPLTGLSTLVNVFVAGNGRISNLEPLRNLTRIQELFVGGNAISDLSALQGLVNLRRLSLRANKITDVTPLRNLQFINVLDLDVNAITDLTPLAGYTRLTSANVRENCLDIAPGADDRLVINGWITRGASVLFSPQKIAAPTLTALRMGSVLRLQWPSEAGVFYRVLSSSNLVDWAAAGTPALIGSGNVLTQDLPGLGQPRQFFRLSISSQ